MKKSKMSLTYVNAVGAFPPVKLNDIALGALKLNPLLDCAGAAGPGVGAWAWKNKKL